MTVSGSLPEEKFTSFSYQYAPSDFQMRTSLFCGFSVRNQGFEDETEGALLDATLLMTRRPTVTDSSKIARQTPGYRLCSAHAHIM